MKFREKILSVEALPEWRAKLRASNSRLVVTNGCFDILHLGHVTYLEEARSFGDELLVGINGDASVTALKGPGRPINSESERASVVAALGSVSRVCVFHDMEALRLLEMLKPDVYVKGGDYTLDTINQNERILVEALGGRIEIVSGVFGKSTTNTLRKLN